MSASQAVLYSQNAFDTANPTPAQLQAMLTQAATIGSSGFTCMILGQWHVHADGSIYYNDTPVADVMGHLPKVVAAIKASGTVQKVLVTFGPFGSDFDHIASNMSAVETCLTNLQTNAQIDGVDWDIEQEYTNTQQSALVTLTNWATDQGMIVTAAPYDYTYIDFWTGLLQDLNGSGATGFAWWNLQLYGGANYPDWVSAIGSILSDPQSFLVPGWNAGDSSPSDVGSALSGLVSSYPDLTGGFIWKLSSAQANGNTLADYASAITNAVSS